MTSRHKAVAKPVARAARGRRAEAVGPYTLLRLERDGLEPGRSRSVLHARGSRPVAPAADEPVPRAARRAHVPHRPDRPRHARALRARAGRRDPCPRPARQRLRPGRRAAAPRRGWDRDRADAVPLRGARTIRPRSSVFAASATREAARLLPVPRSWSSRVSSPSSFPTIPATSSPAGRSRCSRPSAPRPSRTARLGGADGLRVRGLLRLRRRDRRRLRSLCIDGPVLGAA